MASWSGRASSSRCLSQATKQRSSAGDATSLTEAGYVGDDVEILLSKLILTAEGDMDAVQRGIVYIAEVIRSVADTHSDR